MKKTRITALLAAMLMVLAAVLTACGGNDGQASQNGSQTDGSQNETSGDLLDQIKSCGEITVAMEGTWAP